MLKVGLRDKKIITMHGLNFEISNAALIIYNNIVNYT